MTTKQQKMQARYELQQYHRRLKLAAYFQKETDSDPPPFTPKSDWVPPMDKLPMELHTLLEKVLKYFNEHFRPSPEEPNLTPEEVKAL